MRLSKANVPIRSIEEWRTLAPPKQGDRHWKTGRSAKELARAWCGGNEPCAPPDLQKLLEPLLSADHLANAEAWPERQIPIDDIPGERPNIDLALLAVGHHGKTAVCIEAKADEPFGPDVLDRLTSAVVKIARDEKTGAIFRLQRLSALLLPEWEPGLPHLADIRYQLLTLTAAALALAKSNDATIAAVIVHEFAFEGCFDAGKQKRNADDLNRFVKRMTCGTENSLPSRGLVGPIRPHSSNQEWGPMSLYIGKVTSRGPCPQD
jgi:hypothetical protein